MSDINLEMLSEDQKALFAKLIKRANEHLWDNAEKDISAKVMLRALAYELDEMTVGFSLENPNAVSLLIFDEELLYDFEALTDRYLKEISNEIGGIEKQKADALASALERAAGKLREAIAQATEDISE